MRLLCCILSWIVILELPTAQSIEHYNGSLDNAIAIAMLDNKQIFIDVYTDWCAPCKRMHQETFTDPAVVKLLNENFINLKVDAEKEPEKIEDYYLRGYPSFIFLNAAGELIQIELGFKTAAEFVAIAESMMAFGNNERLNLSLRQLKAGTIEKEQLREFAANSQNIDFYRKKDLVLKYYLALSDPERYAEYEFFSENIEHANVDILSLIADAYEGPQGFFISGEERETQREFLNTMKLRINEMLDLAIAENNSDNLQTMIQTNTKFANKSKRLFISAPKDAKKQNETYLLAYYRNNEMKDEYAKLAERMIDRYILPTSPRAAKGLDEERNFIKTKQEEEVLFERKPKTTETEMNPAVDSLESLQLNNPNAYNASQQLNEIAGLLYEFYNADEAKLRMMSKAAYWSSLSYQYFPMAEYYLTHAKLLHVLGEKEKAIEILNQGYRLGSPYPQVLTDIAIFLSVIQEEEEED